MSADFSAARTTIFAALQSTWQTASAVSFVNEGTCTGSYDPQSTMKIRLIADWDARGDCGGLRGASCNVGIRTSARIADVAVHEVGHGLGFPHEHQRPSADGGWEVALCSLEGAIYDQGRATFAADGGGVVEIGNRMPLPMHKLTPWDQQSIMNYCSRKDNNGAPIGGAVLTYYDRLGAEMLYPYSLTRLVVPAKAVAFATSAGRVIRADESLVTDWTARGALPDVYGASEITWRIDSLVATYGVSLPPVLLSNRGLGYHDVWGEFTDVFVRSQYLAPVAVAQDTGLHTALLVVSAFPL